MGLEISAGDYVQVVLYWGDLRARGSCLLWSSVARFPEEVLRERATCVHEHVCTYVLGLYTCALLIRDRKGQTRSKKFLSEAV